MGLIRSRQVVALVIGIATASLIGCGQNTDAETRNVDTSHASGETLSSKNGRYRFAPRAGEGGFTRELHEKIEVFIKELDQGQQTTLENINDRTLLLYDWANALSLEGEWVHPEVTLAVAVITQPDFATMNPRLYKYVVAYVDNFLRELALRRKVPNAFGELSLSIITPAVVNSFHTVEVTYTVGQTPLTVGGGIITPNHYHLRDAEYQATDPAAPNYVTIKSSNGNVTFEPDVFPAGSQFSPDLYKPFSDRLFFRITEGELDTGDTVTVTFGDTSGGSPGLGTIHFSNSALRYPFWLLTAPQEDGGILATLREPTVPLIGGSAVEAHGFGPAMAAVGEEIEISIRAEDRFRNLATENIPAAYQVFLNGELHGVVETQGDAIVRFNAAFDEPGVYRFQFLSSDGSVRGIASPLLVEEAPEEKIFWGETHGHSGWAEGIGHVPEYFEFARDQSRLDFITLSEHDLWMDLGEWAQMKEHVELYNDPGRFITFTGYEYTVDPKWGGHHNVLFRDPETAVLVSRQRHPRIEAMYEGLRRSVPVDDVVVVPHAHLPADWRRSDNDLEKLVEIVSAHGTFEWFGQRYLNEGWEVGFIGSSDDHIGSPGYRPRAFGRPRNDNFGGLAAIYGKTLTRDSIFDSLRNRNAYATNGARIILHADMNGNRMGARIPVTKSDRTLNARIIGTAAISEITLVKNGVDFKTIDYADDLGGESIELAFHFNSDPLALRGSYRDTRFMGEVLLFGATVSSTATPVADALNRETEFASLSEDGGKIEFDLKSGGRINTLVMDFDGVPDGNATMTIDLGKSLFALFDASELQPLELDFEALSQGPQKFVLDAGKRLNSVTVRRITSPSKMEREVSIVDESPSAAGDYYYLRTRQTDGGMAWSSPWWVGAPISRPQPYEIE